MKHNSILFTLSLILSQGLATADAKIIGHMIPLDQELLDQSLTIPNCSGLIIREWRGEFDNTDLDKLGEICKLTQDSFHSFLAQNRLEPQHDRPFNWSISIIPDGQCYRCMNDVKYRFRYRFVPQEVWGYTGRNERYTFTVNNIQMTLYKTIFTHELFHAMSMHYGIFDSHDDDNKEKLIKDEALARAFTKYLGFEE